MDDKTKKSSKRGFASMSPERRREVSAMGGNALSNDKRTFSLDRAIASDAGKKGGASVSPDSRTFSQNRDLAAESGRKGGIAKRNRR
jgi:general stress protein YciG